MSKDTRAVLLLMAIALLAIWSYFFALHHLHMVIGAEGATGEFDYAWHWFDLPMALSALTVVVGCLATSIAIGEGR